MSEYWKSTPKYWCKDCKVYVRDTKFEKAQHEATGRHQGNIRRAINNLHRDVQREEREKQRTKNEVERLNRLVSGGAAASSGPTNATEPSKGPSPKAPKPIATAEDRKKQLAQLAALGVQVPEEFRRENAMVGEWESITIKPIYDESGPNWTAEDDGLEGEATDRKRSLQDATEEGGEGDQRPAKRGWKPALKTYEYKKRNDEEDIGALLGDIKTSRPSIKQETNTIKQEEGIENEEIAGHPNKAALADAKQDIKTDQPVEEPLPGAGIVFKKRKGKPKS